MKKFLALIIAGILTVSLTACGSKGSESDASESAPSSSTEVQPEAKGSNPAANNFIPATSSQTPNYATIKILPTVKMDGDDAWLGLCPAGKDYITEAEADAEDIIYFYAEPKEDEKDSTVFACDFESVEDGTYALVVCTSDDESIGYVAIQMNMTKKNGELTFDYDSAQLRERPAQNVFSAEETPDNPPEVAYGITEKGEDFVVTMNTDSPVGEVVCESAYDYEGGKLQDVVFTYHLEDEDIAKQLEEALKQEPVDTDSIKRDGTVVSCSIAKSDLADLAGVDRDMLYSAMKSTVEQNH